MSFQRFSDDANFDMNSFSGPTSFETMLMARLETRAAVLETELRYAEKERQDAHLATQALLKLLVLYSKNVDIVSAKPQQSAAATGWKQYQQLKQECRRLRVQRSMLRRQATSVRSSRANDITGIHQFVNSKFASQSTPTVSSTKTFVASEPTLVKDKDDFDVEAKQEDAFESMGGLSKALQTEKDDMDDADMYAPWKFTPGDQFANSKPQFVHLFSNSEAKSKLKNVVKHSDLTAQNALAEPVGPEIVIANHVDAESKIEASNTVHNDEVAVVASNDQSEVALSSLQDSSINAVKSRSFRHLTTDPTQDYRMISITDLPMNVAPSDILSKIAGGAVLSLSLVKPAVPGMPTTAHVTFFHHDSAAGFAKYYQNNVLVINEQVVRVALVKIPVAPAVLERVRKEFCTRCLSISSVPSSLTQSDLHKEISMLGHNIEYYIETIQLKDDNSVYLSFLNVETAITIKEYLAQSLKYRGCNVQFASDPCARRLEQKTHTPKVVSESQPQLDALASGSYLWKPQTSNTANQAVAQLKRAIYHAYEDLDITNTAQTTNLDYDDVVDSGVDTGKTRQTKDEPRPNVSTTTMSLIDVEGPINESGDGTLSLEKQDAKMESMAAVRKADLEDEEYQGEITVKGKNHTQTTIDNITQHDDDDQQISILPSGLIEPTHEENDSRRQGCREEKLSPVGLITPFPRFTDGISSTRETSPAQTILQNCTDPTNSENIEEFQVKADSATTERITPNKDRPISARIFEPADALLSVSESPSPSAHQTERSPQSIDHEEITDDANIQLSALSLSSSKCPRLADIGFQEKQEYPFRALPPSYPPLPSSAPTTAPLAPRAMLLQDSKYSSALKPITTTTSVVQRHRQPSPPAFGFSFVPTVKRVKPVPTGPKVVGGGSDTRGRKVVKYDDLYAISPIAQNDTSTSDKSDHAASIAADASKICNPDEEKTMSTSSHTASDPGCPVSTLTSMSNTAATGPSILAHDKQRETESLEAGEIPEHDHNYDGGDEEEDDVCVPPNLAQVPTEKQHACVENRAAAPQSSGLSRQDRDAVAGSPAYELVEHGMWLDY